MKCRKHWNPNLYRTTLHSLDRKVLEVTSAVMYSQVAQRVLLAAKESNIQEADNLISSAIVGAARDFSRREQIDLLIPIPSRKSADRKRGRQFIYAVTVQASSELGIPIEEPLRHSRKVRDQTGLNQSERWNNLSGAFVVKAGTRRGARALLVDDLVTTGATLLAAADALSLAGFQVIGAVTAAIAQPVRLSD
jgi:predicted amidophosphoribosyltransferase